jgi:hypothetical protein
VVMANYSLGYVNLVDAMQECFRLLRQNGILFVFDMFGDGPEIKQYLGYEVRDELYFDSAAMAAGFDTPAVFFPSCSRDKFDQITSIDPPEVMSEVNKALDRVAPIVWRYRRGV